ncbi:CapA family protein [Cohnella hashimotonis]|uniref:CapA family protein n=1 Tax=Cohnella hashimotonis TaxID=2826895 RepID=A0ABT6TNG1_9BACL|nr:CapA family protein [Cohnella hashimotonis]MDI4648392.1 CapA family protein [Cohnella hashimotonis]
MLTVVAALSGCGAQPPGSSAAQHAGAPHTPPASHAGAPISQAVSQIGNPASGATPIPISVKQKKPIKMIFAGDTMMDGSVKDAIRRHGADYPFSQIKDEVSKADYAVLNLETSVTEASDKDLNQRFNFKSEAGSLDGIKHAGFDMVSLGNNHVLDYKEKGLRDTLKNVEKAGLRHVGAGLNEEEAFRFESVQLNGATVKIGAVTRFMPTTAWKATDKKPGVASAYEPDKILAAIRAASKDADYVLIFIHWGVENTTSPQPWQRKLAADMLDAGASAVIGSHPHVLQGFEFHKGKPIAYSIGNFLFPDYVKGKKADTGLLNLTLDKGKVGVSFHPLSIRNNRIVNRDAAYEAAQLAYLEDLSYGVELHDQAFLEQR